jgi:TRAP-type transport system small permease protein
MNRERGKIPAGVKLASELANRVSGFAVVFMMLLIVTEVVLRKFFSRSTTICDEYTGYFQATVIFMSLAQCLRENRHINVDLILRKLPPSTSHVVNIANDLISLAFGSILLWASWKLAWESYLFGTTSYGPSNTPLFLPQAVVLIGLLIFLLQILFSLLHRLLTGPSSSNPNM